jgi:hypothetical protein
MGRKNVRVVLGSVAVLDAQLYQRKNIGRSAKIFFQSTQKHD